MHYINLISALLNVCSRAGREGGGGEVGLGYRVYTSECDHDRATSHSLGKPIPVEIPQLAGRPLLPPLYNMKYKSWTSRERMPSFRNTITP